MSRYEKFVANVPIRRWCVLASVVLVLWLARSIMSSILLTFIFAFLVTRVIKLVRRHFHVPAVAVVAPLYLLVLLGMFYVVVHYVPAIVKGTTNLFNSVLRFYNSQEFAHNQIMQWALTQFNQMNLKEQIQSGVSTILAYAGSIGAMGVTLVISLILSFFFSLEIDSLKTFGQSFLDSPFGWYFADLKYFADKFINTFGVVIEAQIFIALVNTAITTITLIILKMPNLPSLAVMVFILSLIPVAGAIISVVPLTLIGYTVGGWQNVAVLIIMIIVIHILEAYVLNPKFMSSRTQLPVFFTFVVLMLSEELFGIWGLIVGIPIFTFLLDVLGVKKIAKPKD
ncbi:AI-2E family transporter [Lacticaseibacillus nasuensis]|uniref:Permease n=1 Tax=Lacticaseibacillus nasuensis JCM 17158 TaxID=1291734 RepID=A0A0R1JTM8_9LACO|nr:AI-2E family transporter [Lacticaseibacillus nasuensis]KRK70914.1 permease [Lacticaseibacillus nasuensis JCM 17158]